jgi:hypothetical protein
MTKLSVAMSLDQSFKKAASNMFEYCLYHFLENDEVVSDFYACYKNLGFQAYLRFFFIKKHNKLRKKTRKIKQNSYFQVMTMKE